MSKVTSWVLALGLTSLALEAQVPPAVIPAGVGVNIHFVTGHETDLDMIADAGFRFIRMDFQWDGIERTQGNYDWSAYDQLTANLEKRGLRAIYILDYKNALYEAQVPAHRAVGEPVPEEYTASPRHPESVAAFAKWAAEAARHFHGRGVIWEIYNEPNGNFWRPKPDVGEYTTLALATAKAIREAEPSATIIAPAMSTFDWKFLEPFLKSGVLEYLDAVSVHPYRPPNKSPETAEPEYKRLRELIESSAPESKRPNKIAIISGEWGYASNRKGVTLDAQADFAVRQQLSNLLYGVPLSIWYDWKNDGTDPDDGEQNFGTVTPELKPKPAYTALRNMTQELNGYSLQERLGGFDPNDFVLVFARDGNHQTVAAWTMAKPHLITVHIAGRELSLELGALPQYVPVK
ncbi:MAG: cellulase family glycosylhydrolase [Limisphaerales bacterium]